MQHHEGGADALLPQLEQQLPGEGPSRGRHLHGPRFPGEDGLVPIEVPGTAGIPVTHRLPQAAQGLHQVLSPQGEAEEAQAGIGRVGPLDAGLDSGAEGEPPLRGSRQGFSRPSSRSADQRSGAMRRARRASTGAPSRRAGRLAGRVRLALRTRQSPGFRKSGRSWKRPWRTDPPAAVRRQEADPVPGQAAPLRRLLGRQVVGQFEGECSLAYHARTCGYRPDSADWSSRRQSSWAWKRRPLT